MLTAFSNWSALASNFDEVLEKYTSHVHLTPGADIDATTVLMGRDVRNAASALDPINENTAAVPNIADPFCMRAASQVDTCGLLLSESLVTKMLLLRVRKPFRLLSR
jgi:hypothetical protein